jgi:metal-dependent amidase/aminoacylase/carboxypeptidase family protein
MKSRFLLSLLFIMLVSCQLRAQKTLTHKSINLETDNIFAKLVEIRRDFHENPELAGNEIHTEKVIEKYLLDLGLQVDTNIYGHSVVGILKGGKKGKKIAWRAEMDAVPTSNIKDVQHGCGHDIHMAIALGIAEVLAKNKRSLPGTVYFIFQPEEEAMIGAKNMVDSGLFSKIHPDEIYALHVTNLQVGQIMVKPNEIFAYQRRIRVKLKSELTNEQAKDLTKKYTARYLVQVLASLGKYKISLTRKLDL